MQKLPKAKGLEAQVIEQLPNNCETLSSNPSTKKKRKKKKINQKMVKESTEDYCLWSLTSDGS
jgi:hypothetical protein